MDHLSPQDLDYLKFLYGLVCIVTGIGACWLRRIPDLHPAWRWFVLFAFTHGLREWFDAAAMSIANPPFVPQISLGLLAGSFCFLLAFGCTLAAAIHWQRVSIWICAILLLCALTGAAYGSHGLNMSLRLAVLLPGGILTAGALQAYRRRVYPNVTALTVAAVIMGVFAVLGGLVVPLAAVYPATMPGSRAVAGVAGIPLHLVLCGCMTALGAHLWAFYGQVYCSLFPETRKYYSFHTVTRFLVILMIVLGIGWMLTVQFGTITKENIRNAKLAATQSLAAGINPAHIAGLSGSAADTTTPHFNTLKQQLEAAHRATPLCRFTYIMGRRGGEVVILVDAEPAASKDYSPPGQVYAEATPQLYSVFTDGKPAVEGPVTDRWGTWISTLVPIRDHNSNTVLAVLGQDIDATAWQTVIFRSRLLTILITLLVAVIVVGFFLLHQRNLEAGTRITASEERYRVLVEGSPNTICLLDLNGCILAVNQAGIALVGEPAVQLRGKRLGDLVQAANRGAVDAAVARARAGEQARFEAAVPCADGKTVIWEGLLNPVRDTDTAVRYCIGLFIDVTQRKLAEKERENLIGELQSALHKVKLLSGLLPICAACKKIRDDKGYWNQIEEYIEDHSQAMFSHGLCPECMKKLYPDFDREGTG